MPELEIYRAQRAASNQLRVVNVQSAPADTSVGDALTAIGELGMRIETGRAQAEAAKLEVEAKRRYDAAYRELQADPEAADQLESRLIEKSREIRGELLGQVKSATVREGFDQRLSEIETGYVIEGRNLSNRRAVEAFGADVVGLIDGLDKTSKDISVPMDDPKNPHTRTVKSEANAAQALIDAGVRGGFIGKDDAAVKKAIIQAKLEEGDSARVLANVDKLIENGQIAEAEAFFEDNDHRILPEKREAARKVFREQTREAKAIQTVDALWDKHAGDYSAVIAEIGKMDNPQDRLAAEARAGVRLNQQRVAEDETQTAVINSALMAITTGKPVPADVLRAANGKTRDFIDDQLYQRRLREQQLATLSAEERAALNQVSIGSYRILKAQLNDKELANKGLEAILADPQNKALWDRMTPDEQGAFMLDASNAKANGGVATDTVSKAYKSVSALAGAYMPQGMKPNEFDRKFRGAGEGDPGVKRVSANRKKSDAALAFEGELLGLVEEEVSRTGNAEIPADRAKQLVALAYAKAGEKKDGTTRYPLSADVAGGIISTEARRDILDFRAANPDLWATTTEMVRSKYPEASDAVILEEARRIQMYRQTEQAVETVRGMFGGDQ